jgi:hypothetical protein
MVPVVPIVPVVHTYSGGSSPALSLPNWVNTQHRALDTHVIPVVKVLNGRGHYALGPVEQFMMQNMIVEPAKCAGLTVSDNLARHIVNDTGSESANLPLLAFVLNQLFEKRSDHDLSEKVYRL